MIAIIDYDIGNLGAVANMLSRIGATCAITNDPELVAAASGIILPGNGSFDACMRNFNDSGLRDIVERRVLIELVPLLGICVGAQMLGIASEEGNESGLGWLDMQVRRFPEMDGLRIPHMGWNEVRCVKADDPLCRSLDDGARFYFVHSYRLVPADPADCLLEANYGVNFTAGVARGNVRGVQFHPEKSHRFGKQLLGAFAELC